MSKYIDDLRDSNALNNLKIEYVNIDLLKPNSYNPNKHNVSSFDLLIQSVRLFGFTQPIVVRKGTNEIIDGEHRWRVASVLDLELVPVVFVELTDEKMRIATILHNRARGEENKELISEIEGYLDKQEIDFNKILLKDR